MICPYCDLEYTLDHPCRCQASQEVRAARPQKSAMAPALDLEKCTENPPAGLDNPFWN